MVRITKERIIEGNKKHIEAAGLSTDTKPSADIVTGSLFLEVDTGNVLAFDEVDSEWKTIAEPGGGS